MSNWYDKPIKTKKMTRGQKAFQKELRIRIGYTKARFETLGGKLKINAGK